MRRALHSVELPGATVDDVISAAVQRFGPTFESGVARARVWLNGEEANGADPVGDGDELALIPPVSGGSDVVTMPAGISPAALTLALIGLALAAANVFGTEAWVAAAVVGAVAVWVADIASTVASRGKDLPVIPVLVTVIAAVVGTRILGGAGLAVAAAMAVIAPMVWGVISETSRLLTIIAPDDVGVAAGGAFHCLAPAGSLHPECQGVRRIHRGRRGGDRGGRTDGAPRSLPFGDPFTISAISAIATAVIAAAVWDLDLATFLFVGVVLAVGLVAGRTLGSIIRTGTASLVERPPGLTFPLDGVVACCDVVPPRARRSDRLMRYEIRSRCSDGVGRRVQGLICRTACAVKRFAVPSSSPCC